MEETYPPELQRKSLFKWYRLVEKHTERLWIYENYEMVHKSVSYVTALSIIFNEMLALATKKRMGMDYLKVTIDPDRNFFRVTSNGAGKKLNTKNREWEAVGVIAYDLVRDTTITFKPHLDAFNMTELEDDVTLMKKRVVDYAGILGKSVKVELDGKCVPVNSFTDYVSLYLQAASKSRSESADHPRISEKLRYGWEICLSLCKGQFQQVSFVNGFATIKGGTHVDYVTDQICNHLVAVANKNNGAIITARTIQNYLWVFVNSWIDKPDFDTAAKEILVTSPHRFESKCKLSPEFLKKVEKSGIVDTILHWEDLKKTDRVTKIDTMFDAKEAGGKNSDKCTLILTVGDVANFFAARGISSIGRDYYGVYSLSRKLLDVRAGKYHKLCKCKAEIGHIEKILGAQARKVYENVESLRYGHLMVMTDEYGGSHFKGLLINFIRLNWPSLLRIPSFLVDSMTPIVKATDLNGEVLSFYSMPECETWIKRLGGNTSGWAIKHKGLGSWTEQEVKEYFSDLDNHKNEFVWEDEQDDVAMELAFSNNIKKRMDWLRQFKPGTYLDRKEKRKIKYRDYVNKELIWYAMEKVQREIPSMVDGLNPCQRKILFCCLKFNLVKELGVIELAWFVLKCLSLAWHEILWNVEASIIGLAQDFVGSHNINFLQPCSGDFGSRYHGGKCGILRRMSTVLSPITRYLFHKDDDDHLYYPYGHSVEPTWYMPVIPTVLVNGSKVTGTEWRTYIPKYNPRDIIANIRRLLNGERMKPMVPWYKSFRGTIKKSATEEGGVSYTCAGIIEDINKTTFRITELPVKRWTGEYLRKLKCTKLIGSKKAVEPFIKDVIVRSIDYMNVDIKLVLPSEEEMAKVKKEGMLKKFNLTTTISTRNMYLLDSKGVIKKYDTPEQIIEEFHHLRLELYERRKYALLMNLAQEMSSLVNEESSNAEQLRRNIVEFIGLKKMSSRSLWIQDLDALDSKLDGSYDSRDDEDDTNDDEVEVLEAPPPATTKAAAKPPVAGKKRGRESMQTQAGQKLVSEEVSPETKVMKLTTCPFNKMSGSVSNMEQS